MFDWSELTNWNEYTQLLISLMAMVPPSVLIPFFLSLVGKRTPAEQKQVALLSAIGFSVVSISLVPMTIPMLSGPGAISTVVIFSSMHEGISHKILVSMVILTVSLFIYLMFSTSLRLGRFLSPGAALAFNRIMGLIIMAVAIEFIIHGLGGHFPDLNIVH